MLKFETFVKLMMMTTSNHDAECLTAIRSANRLLAREGKNWEELITGLVPMEQEAKPEARQRPRTETPPWADDGDGPDIPHRGDPDYQAFIFRVFEEAIAKTKRGTSFGDTIKSIHEWWLEKGFVTDKQLKAVLKAAGRV
jgi:hypothetical protein